jgi:hypothetical protein
MFRINLFRSLIKNKKNKNPKPSGFISGGFFFAYEKNITLTHFACNWFNSGTRKNKLKKEEILYTRN